MREKENEKYIELNSIIKKGRINKMKKINE